MIRLEYLRYRLLKVELYIYLNFGRSEFNGTQFFKLRFIPKKNVKNDYVLNQFYNTREIWSLGSYFVCFDFRDSYD
jgi:hypothetical protein